MGHRDIANNLHLPYRVDEDKKQIILNPDEDYVPMDGEGNRRI